MYALTETTNRKLMALIIFLEMCECHVKLLKCHIGYLCTATTTTS